MCVGSRVLIKVAPEVGSPVKAAITRPAGPSSLVVNGLRHLQWNLALLASLRHGTFSCRDESPAHGHAVGQSTTPVAFLSATATSHLRPEAVTNAQTANCAHTPRVRPAGQRQRWADSVARAGLKGRRPTRSHKHMQNRRDAPRAVDTPPDMSRNYRGEGSPPSAPGRRRRHCVRAQLRKVSGVEGAVGVVVQS